MRVGQLARDVGLRIAQREAKRLGKQGISCQDRHVLAEADVRAGLPAPQIVVVERRQVVVHQAERVHELERARGRKHLVRVTTERLARGQAEHRPDALAATEKRVPQGLFEAPELSRERKLT